VPSDHLFDAYRLLYSAAPRSARLQQAFFLPLIVAQVELPPVKGTDAAHEDDPFTGDEAKTLQAFTEMFLTYASLGLECSRSAKQQRRRIRRRLG
jgi:hypothetical protein